MTPITWLLLLGGVALNAAAQLLLKAATRTSGVLVSDSGELSWSAVAQLARAYPLWIGLSFYGVSVILWLGALSRVPGERCLSHALRRLRRERHRRRIPVR